MRNCFKRNEDYYRRRAERITAMKITRREHADRQAARDKGFMQGYAVALVILSKVNDLATANRVLREGNFTLKSFYKQEIDTADMKILREITKS